MSPRVTLRLLSIFVEIIGKKEIEYEADTVKDVIDQFLGEYRERLEDQLLEETGYFKDWVIILLNGTKINFLDGLETKLKSNDVVVIMPLMGGG